MKSSQFPNHVFLKTMFPTKWKNGVTILDYKSVSASDPGNFRSITLQPVMSKIFTVIIKNRIYDYLFQNNFIDLSTQKGFWSSISGTIEHTESLTYLLNNAKNKQIGLVVTLVDLQNAFGEVNHNFLSSVLKFHHLPDEMIHLINNLFSGYQIPIVTNNFITPPITIEKGVLQGDSLSPLLFNLCFNTLMLTVNQKRVKCLGYTSNALNFIKHWSQLQTTRQSSTSLNLTINIF